MSAHAPEAFFLPVETPVQGQRFCLFHPAQGQTLRGRVVYVHPFAEEMNKSRRMAALGARALAAAGFSVLQIDLHGCGDSSGDFGDAGWQDWIDDVVRASIWLRERDDMHARAPLWLWGLRAGCLVAAEAAALMDEPSNFCFWKPATTGSLLLQQFLRLKLAADMLAGSSKGLMDAMRQQLADGQAVEIAGYRLSAALAKGLMDAQLKPPAASATAARVEWIELAAAAQADLSPVARQALTRWTETGFDTREHYAQGPSFWQTAEIEDAPELVAVTVSALLRKAVSA